MDSHKLALKLYVADPSLKAGSDVFVPLFHSWIQQHKIPDHLLIDVADYQHVPDGPGTLLIAYEANFAMDKMDGRLGLMYVRKQPFPDADTFSARLRAALRAEFQAAVLLEKDPRLAGRIQFVTNEITFRIHDRLHAPNTPETFAAVKGDLEATFGDLYGAPPKSLQYTPAAEALFEVRIQMPSSPDVALLLDRLSPSGAAAIPTGGTRSR